MSNANDTLDLPTSRSQLRRLAEAFSWDDDRALMQQRSERRAWQVASGAALLALLGMGFGLFQSLRPPPAAVPIVVDRSTGEAVVMPPLETRAAPQLAALDLHHAARYVRARESYHFHFLQRDYDQVARMSTPDVFKAYNAAYSGQHPLQDKLGDRELHRVTIVNVRLDPRSTPGRHGVALVTFDKEVRGNGTAPSTTRAVATVAYDYRPAAVKKSLDQLENPFGFVVSQYRADAEFAPAQPVAASAAWAAAPATSPR